ncbi:MAG: hypothetical protein AABO58_00135 [Acidobacteriota bacterium]
MIRHLLLCSLFAATAMAQAPHEDWRTITTAHFRVHYPAPFEAWATRAAGRLESVRDAVVAEVGFAPEQVTDVLVVDPVAEANGQAIPLLDTPRMILFAQPPGPETQIGEYSDWIDLLTVHETAHLVHLLRPSRNPFERFAERFLPLNPIVLRAPRWIFEGYATVIEGRITGSGRPSGSMRAAILRKWALEGRLPTYAQIDSDRRFLGMSMAYLMGSAFLEWLEQRSGPDAMRHIWARLTARQRRNFDEAFAGVYGERPDRLYGRFVAELTERAVALARSEAPREGELWQETSRGSGDPAVSPDGKSLAMVVRPEKGDAKLVVLSTEENEEEKKYQERIEKILKRDPQDVAPVRGKPLPRKPRHTLKALDGGDLADPRWTRDGASIVYTHKQPDRDGVLHHDLFRWTPAGGENTRLTHLADVKDGDPLPDGKRAVAVRDRFGFSQLVYVDLETGAVTPMNEPSLDVVYTHPRAAADGRIAWSEHRGGVWRVGDIEGAFSPEWGKDGALYAAVAKGGFIDIVKVDGLESPSHITQTLGAAIDPAPSPDGSLYFMSLEPDGFVVRHIDVGRVLNPSRPAEGRSFVPALPPQPSQPVALRTDPVTQRPYGLGRQEISTFFGGVHTSFENDYEFGVRLGDVVGRLDTLLIGSTRGAALASVWRGWPVDVGLHLFRADGERGAEVRGRWDATYPRSRLVVEGGTGSRSFLHASFATRQRRLAYQRLDVAADSDRHLRVTARAALRAGGFEAAAQLTHGRRLAVGGAASSIEPVSLLIARVLDPALDRGTLDGERYRGERVELRSGAVAAFWQRHSTNRTIDLFGLEATLSRDPLPIVKAAGLDLTAGIARVRQQRKTRAWLAMRWRP